MKDVEKLRFIESFFPNKVVLVVFLKMLSTDGCLAFLTVRPISMASKLSSWMNQR